MRQQVSIIIANFQTPISQNGQSYIMRSVITGSLKVKSLCSISIMVLTLASAESAHAFENFTGFTRLNTLGETPPHDPFGYDPSQTTVAPVVSAPTTPEPHPSQKQKSKRASAKGLKAETKIEAAPQELWGPVPSPKLSVANIAPGLLPFFNNGPVFGLPGTLTGDFANRTQVNGDWGGSRTEFARHGWFFDVYTTSTYQDVTSGGMKTGSAFVQNTQASVNVDLGRAGLTDGGLFHFTLQSRYGATPDSSFSAGTAAPQYTGLVEPGPYLYKNTLPSEYFLVQPLTKKFSVVLGKISDVYIPDQTLFGNSYKYYFANFNFNKNPITTQFYNPTAWAGLGVFTPTENWAIGGGVLDTETKSSNFVQNAFKWCNVYLTSIFSYNIAGLPGQLTPSLNWSNKPKVDFSRPFSPLVGFADQQVSSLLGEPTMIGLPMNYKHESWFAIANASQYLYVRDDADTVKGKLKSGDPINGVGVFARGGYAPQSSNTINGDGSIAIFAHGLAEDRPHDSFGAGFYYNKISGLLKRDVSRMTLFTRNIQDEKGMETFYDFAITPAIRFIPSYQHIWNPLISQAVKQRDHADVFLTRVTIAW